MNKIEKAIVYALIIIAIAIALTLCSMWLWPVEG